MNSVEPGRDLREIGDQALGSGAIGRLVQDDRVDRDCNPAVTLSLVSTKVTSGVIPARRARS
jgi:hypothetical protein